MSMIVNLDSVNEGLYTVKIKREVGNGTETREFSKAGLEEYLDSSRSYCEHKGYEFIFNDNGLLPQWGGKREGAGRPVLGTTKKVSLTLPLDIWNKIEETKENEGISQSAVLRSIVEDHYTTTTDQASPEEKEQRFAEFKEFVFDTDISRLRFHIYQHGLLVVSPVEKVESYYNDAGVKVYFKGGNFHMWAENKLSKCYRPGNLMIECETCYNLYNEYEAHIGYLYTEKQGAAEQ